MCVIKIGPGPVNPGEPGKPPPVPVPVDPEDPRLLCNDPLTGAVLGCVIGEWVWSDGWACHTMASDPQPPASDPVWPPGSDGVGVIYDCARGIDLADPLPYEVIQRHSPSPPWSSPPNPEQLAEAAIVLMQLRAAEIGIVPEQGADRVGLVGLPTWMWVDDVGDSTWGPITRTATAGPWSVTATGKVDRIEWDMGDGTVVTCETPGTPYQDSFQDADSPDCGHRYEQPGLYAVSATSYWVITWSGLGQTGTIELDVTQDGQIVMGEVQVLNQQP